MVYIKSLVHAKNPQIIEEVYNKIRSVVDEIESRLCENVIKNEKKDAIVKKEL